MSSLTKLRPYLPMAVIDAVKSFEKNLAEIRIKKDCRLSVTLVSGESGQFGFGENRILDLVIGRKLFEEILDMICNHSLYSHMPTLVEGYLTLSGGYRVGVYGRAVCADGKIMNLSGIEGMNIRIPRHVEGCSKEIIMRLEASRFQKSILLYSPPNMGKTTILRDIAAGLVKRIPPRRVVVVDTRYEIENDAITNQPFLDILSGYPRGKGIEIATRTLSPQYILCDEIGDYEEVIALLSSQNCGVPVIATAHASSVTELLSRRNIAILHRHHVFSEYVGIKRLRWGEAPLLSFVSSKDVGFTR